MSQERSTEAVSAMLGGKCPKCDGWVRLEAGRAVCSYCGTLALAGFRFKSGVRHEGPAVSDGVDAYEQP